MLESSMTPEQQRALTNYSAADGVSQRLYSKGDLHSMSTSESKKSSSKNEEEGENKDDEEEEEEEGKEKEKDHKHFSAKKSAIKLFSVAHFIEVELSEHLSKEEKEELNILEKSYSMLKEFAPHENKYPTNKEKDVEAGGKDEFRKISKTISKKVKGNVDLKPKKVHQIANEEIHPHHHRVKLTKFHLVGYYLWRSRNKTKFDAETVGCYDSWLKIWLDFLLGPDQDITLDDKHGESDKQLLVENAAWKVYGTKHFNKIFVGESESFLFKALEVGIMFNCLYMAVWTTNMVTIVHEQEYEGHWAGAIQFAMIIP
jgi:hypothetical protein